MTAKVARTALDYILSSPETFSEEAVVYDFLGGEPLMEIDLIHFITHYALVRAYELEHRWFANSRFIITTNGFFYRDQNVQRYIEKFRDRLQVVISIDGPPHVHDIGRISSNGNGTYALIDPSIKLWLKQFPHTNSKVTITHETLPYLVESVLHLFDLGIREVNAGIVFEAVWLPGDDEIYERQLDMLADEMIKTNLWKDRSCTFFNKAIGLPMEPADQVNFCGTGKMLTIDTDGTFFPCHRFTPFSLNNASPRKVGNIVTGLNQNYVRPFLALSRGAQSPPNCMSCDIASGCGWCQGFNFDDAPVPTIYHRATHICGMHKARVRANNRYWEKVAEAGEVGNENVYCGS